jgi:hypothetical protein
VVYRYADTVIPVFFSVKVDLVHVILPVGFEHNIVDAPSPITSTLPTFVPSGVGGTGKLDPAFDWSEK